MQGYLILEMRFSPEIRHTCGCLLWLRRQAEFEHRTASRAGDAVHRRFLELVRWRFGRDISGIGGEDSSIEEFGSGIQVLPQIDAVRPRFLFREGPTGAGRILMLPGLHGTAGTFCRLASMVHSPMTIVGWDHLGLDESCRRPKRIDEIASSMLEVECQQGLQDDEPLIVFGFCIGGILGHSILEQAGSRTGNLVILDGHPANSMRRISRTRRVIGMTRAIRDAARGGRIESRLVRIGLDRFRAMGLHQAGRIEQSILLYRSGARLGLGPLSEDDWRGHARGVRQHDLPDLGHVDVFRNHHEQRIIDGILAA